MPGNTENYRSILGTFFTLLAFMIVMSYASYKMVSLDSHKDYNLVQEIHEQYYDSSEQFTSSDKFWVAAGIISYGDGDLKQIEDPEIGVLKFYHKSWGVHDDND